MTARFADVLEISLAMSVVLAVLLALRPLLKKRLRAGAFYWVWLLAALRLQPEPAPGSGNGGGGSQGRLPGGHG